MHIPEHLHAQTTQRGDAATITFTRPTGHIFGIEPKLLEALPGVYEVREHAGRITIRGDRPAIAHVGAALVGAGWVPPDLSVHVPSLEDALVDLLERADALGAGDLVGPDPRGARR